MEHADPREDYKEIVSKLVNDLKADFEDEESETQIQLNNPTSTSDQLASLMNPIGARVLFLGLNPEPNGMVAYGIPIGDLPNSQEAVTDDAIKEENDQPFWTLMRDICGTKDHFFSNCFVHDLCPLTFRNNKECNVEPFDVRIGSQELRGRIEERCIDALVEVLLLLQPEFIVAMGKDEYEKAQMALRKCYLESWYGLLDRERYLTLMSPRVVRVPHPNAKSGRNSWTADRVTDILKSHGILRIIKSRRRSSGCMPPKSVPSDMPPRKDMSTVDSMSMPPKPQMPSMLSMLGLPSLSDMSKTPVMPSMQGLYPMPTMIPMAGMFPMSGSPFTPPKPGMSQMMGTTPIPAVHPTYSMPPMMGMRPMPGMSPCGGMPSW